MLQRADPETELIREPQQHEDLVLSVGMTVNDALVFEDLGERFEFDVLAHRRDPIALWACLERSLRGAILASSLEAVAQECFDPHAGLGISTARPHHILAERELDPWLRAAGRPLRKRRAPLELDHAVLSADRIRAAVQLIDAGHATCELAIPVHIIGVDHIADAYLRGTRFRCLVHGPFHASMAVAVDDARREMHPAAVDGAGIRGLLEPLTDRRNAPTLDEHIAVADDSTRRACPHRGGLEQRILRVRRSGLPEVAERSGDSERWARRRPSIFLLAVVVPIVDLRCSRLRCVRLRGIVRNHLRGKHRQALAIFALRLKRDGAPIASEVAAQHALQLERLAIENARTLPRLQHHLPTTARAALPSILHRSDGDALLAWVDLEQAGLPRRQRDRCACRSCELPPCVAV